MGLKFEFEFRLRLEANKETSLSQCEVWPKQGSETREISVAQVGFFCSGRKYKYTKYTNTQIHKIHKYTNKDTRLGY